MFKSMLVTLLGAVLLAALIGVTVLSAKRVVVAAFRSPQVIDGADFHALEAGFRRHVGR